MRFVVYFFVSFLNYIYVFIHVTLHLTCNCTHEREHKHLTLATNLDSRGFDAFSFAMGRQHY